jgi:hypothetical protein
MEANKLYLNWQAFAFLQALMAGYRHFHLIGSFRSTVF